MDDFPSVTNKPNPEVATDCPAVADDGVPSEWQALVNAHVLAVNTGRKECFVLAGPGHTYTAHRPCPWRIARAGQQKMCENVPLLKRNDLRRGRGAIQRKHHRPEGGAGMFLSDGDLRAGRPNTGSGDGVPPGRRHVFGTAKAPERPVQWPRIGKEHWFRQCPQEPVQLGVVPGFLFQYPRIAVGLRRTWDRRRISCWCLNGPGANCWGVHGFGVFIGARRSAGQGDQQAQGKRKPVPPVLGSHISMVGTPAVQKQSPGRKLSPAAVPTLAA